MTLSQDTVGIIAVVAAGVALCALVLSLRQTRRLRRLRRERSLRRLLAGDGGNGSSAVSAGDLRELALELTDLREVVGHAVQCVGLVRFDAFEDMGGRLSFAAALLDAEGSGIVFSSINGRSETRIYAKPIERGASRYNLSDEEEEAIRRALGAVRR